MTAPAESRPEAFVSSAGLPSTGLASMTASLSADREKRPYTPRSEARRPGTASPEAFAESVRDEDLTKAANAGAGLPIPHPADTPGTGDNPQLRFAGAVAECPDDPQAVSSAVFDDPREHQRHVCSVDFG